MSAFATFLAYAGIQLASDGVDVARASIDLTVFGQKAEQRNQLLNRLPIISTGLDYTEGKITLANRGFGPADVHQVDLWTPSARISLKAGQDFLEAHKELDKMLRESFPDEFAKISSTSFNNPTRILRVDEQAIFLHLQAVGDSGEEARKEIMRQLTMRACYTDVLAEKRFSNQNGDLSKITDGCPKPNAFFDLPMTEN